MIRLVPDQQPAPPTGEEYRDEANRLWRETKTRHVDAQRAMANVAHLLDQTPVEWWHVKGCLTEVRRLRESVTAMEDALTEITEWADRLRIATKREDS